MGDYFEILQYSLRTEFLGRTFRVRNRNIAITVFFFFSQMTAVHPVGEGQCVALGYESVLPLVLLTLQGGDMKPYEFPPEGTKAMAGTGAI